ncbi:cellulase family glycosylhydrolase [Patescibacteria group bacterium]|nr:cellulase family glycosylhydrolase [Patescibacteria group bacterium]
MGKKKPQLNFKVRYSSAETLRLLRKQAIMLIPVITIILIIIFVQLFFTKQKGPVETRTRATNERPIFGLASAVSYKDYNTTYSGNIDKELDLIRDAGAKWVRLSLSWGWSEGRAKGTFDENYLSQLDSVVAKAQARGINVLFVTDGSPFWANPGGKNYPPTNPQDYADWFTVMVNRFKTKGVHHWEVWNEPNLGRFWGGTPNAAQYVQLLKVSYAAIKAADPTATVISAGLAQGGGALEPTQFLKDLYAAGLKGNFDKIGFHPYCGKLSPDTWSSSSPRDSFPVTQYGIRQTMVDNGDSDKQIWLTEMGYSTYKNSTGGTGTYGVDEATQATYLKKAYQKVALDWPFVDVMFWFTTRNSGTSPTNFEHNIGITTYDYVLKPAYDAYKQTAALYSSNPSITPTGVVATITSSQPPPVAPTTTPTAVPTAVPTATPVPTRVPTAIPTPFPTAVPTRVPTTIPTIAPTIAPTISLRYEAESAVMYGSLFANNHLGYTGTGFADYINKTGDYLLWTVNAPVSGNYKLNFRYANSGSNRPLEIKINNVTVNSSLSFSSTKSWDVWRYSSVNTRLNAGVNTIKATVTGRGGPNMDHLLITSY